MHSEATFTIALPGGILVGDLEIKAGVAVPLKSRRNIREESIRHQARMDSIRGVVPKRRTALASPHSTNTPLVLGRN